jgi:vacuolar-type H+-ATPase subunit E/Vma4
MEELRDAQALEQEIMDDSRKKAERILRNRDKAIEEVRAEWEKRTTERLATLNREHEEMLGRLEIQNSAALPLEKKRAFLQFAETHLTAAMKEYFATFDETRLAGLLGTVLAPAAEIIGSEKVTVRQSGIGAEIARKVVQNALPDVQISGEIEEFSADERAAIVASTAGNAIVLTGSTSRIEKELSRKHRDVLLGALLQGRTAP